jgi:hypothetical protein
MTWFPSDADPLERLDPNDPCAVAGGEYCATACSTGVADPRATSKKSAAPSHRIARVERLRPGIGPAAQRSEGAVPKRA